MSTYFLDVDVFAESMLQRTSKMVGPWVSRSLGMAVHSPKGKYLPQLFQARQCDRRNCAPYEAVKFVQKSVMSNDMR